MAVRCTTSQRASWLPLQATSSYQRRWKSWFKERGGGEYVIDVWLLNELIYLAYAVTIYGKGLSRSLALSTRALGDLSNGTVCLYISGETLFRVHY